MSKLTVDVTSHDHIQGHPNAACSLVEYGDYECPSCGAAQLIIKRLQERFGTQLSFGGREGHRFLSWTRNVGRNQFSAAPAGEIDHWAIEVQPLRSYPRE